MNAGYWISLVLASIALVMLVINGTHQNNLPVTVHAILSISVLVMGIMLVANKYVDTTMIGGIKGTRCRTVEEGSPCNDGLQCLRLSDKNNICVPSAVSGEDGATYSGCTADNGCKKQRDVCLRGKKLPGNPDGVDMCVPKRMFLPQE